MSCRVLIFVLLRVLVTGAEGGGSAGFGILL